MYNLLGIATLMLLTVVHYGCEGAASSPKKSASNNTPNQPFNQNPLDPNKPWFQSQDSANAIQDDTICPKIKENAAVMARASEELTLLCSRITDLRNPSVIYKGESEAKIIFVGEKVPGQETVSRAIIISSLQQNNKAKHFASKVKLEVSNPDKFRSDGFEMTPDENYIAFNTLKVTNESTEFNYENRTDRHAVVAYEGKSTFHTIIPDELYVIVSKAEKTIRTIEEFTALIVVHTHPQATGDIEVFAYTKEAYQNFGGHEDLMRKLRNKFADEQMRGYRNGLHARDIGLDY